MRRLTATVFFFILLLSPGLAAERITNFISEVGINVDSSIDVTETIAVNVEGDQIKRGILRDFPTRYRSRDGSEVEIGFDVVAVKRDGQSENYAVESIANGVRIKIGNRDVLLAPGPHSYEISYRATKEMGFFEGFDELYWNVTGNGWTFPIERAEAIIHLPPGAKIIQHAAYTGPQGAKGTDYRVTSSEGTIYRAQTTSGLAPGEGFTVAVGFTKGIVTPPPPEADTTKQSFIAMGGGLGVVFLYYLFAWLRVGRDPKGSAIIPLWSAPAELGAAGVRYVWKHGFDAKVFATGAIGIAAKGRFKIAELKNTFRIVKQQDNGSPLSLSEKKMYGAHPGGTLELKDKNHNSISTMRKALEGSLEADYGAATWRSNRSWLWSGLILSLGALVPMIMFVRAEDFVMAAAVSLLGGGLWALFVWLLFLDVRAFFKPGVLRKIFTLIGFLVLVPIVITLTVFPVAIVGQAEEWSVAIYAAGLAALAVMHVLFALWLTAPTVLGRKLMDQIEGLRLYMATAEEKRLGMLNPPEKTPELFEKLLPYAIALDCENIWGEKFAAVLAAASYVAPAWYVGQNFAVNRFDNFSNDLNTSQYDHTARTSSSSSSPGSFSGSSGGGSSGGGGGGGGGSGW